MITNLLWMFTGFILLFIGGSFIIRSSISLSLKLNLSKLVIGMTVVAFATSLPELLVSVTAALNGSPSIAINNVIGSNIANIGLVLGITCMIGAINVKETFYRIDWPAMMIFSIILWILGRDKKLDEIEGGLLLLLLIVFISYVITFSLIKYKESSIDNSLVYSSSFKIFVWVIIASLALYFGSELLVSGAINFASDMGVSEGVVALSVIAIGTSIPELATSLLAIIKGEKGISLGNLIGSNIFNIGSVLGITAIIKPIVVDDWDIFSRDIIVMIAFAFAVLVMAILPKRHAIGKTKGFFLLLLYSIFMLYIIWP